MRFLKRPANAKPKKGQPNYEGQKEIAYVVIGGITLLLMFYVLHCTWVRSFVAPSLLDRLLMRIYLAGYQQCLFLSFHRVVRERWKRQDHFRRFQRGLLLAQPEHQTRRENHVLVGLWLPDFSHGEPYCIGRQQHMEQQSHRPSRKGNVAYSS